MEYREENNYPKAFAATGVILAAVIAMCYFIVFREPAPAQEGTGGILVNYGTVDEGMGSDYMSTEEPSVAEKANNSKPDKVTPAPPTEEKVQADNSDKNVVTQTNEDAPEVTANSKAPSNTVATTPTKTEAKPSVNQNALYKGKTNNGTGAGDGTGNTPGNQGKTTGTTLTNNYNGTGSGNGGGLNLTQRNFVSKPNVSDDGRNEGKVVVDIRVDKDGTIIYAAVGRGTTIADNSLLQRCVDAVKNSRVSAVENSDEQRGNVVFVFKRH
ncbi:energy transducer TonB [Mucilaginibacter pallidiroseus]|uniref:Energy transducer TonB n=1 Tax=Mucilaginibacter pallidiroseus TaxID=2599295 RepID=A0A563UD87_9SPHI|nr:energy transducer TonB [Mucilaginibacter pallidiroseus]TWR29352.1 energy transducer TonB [Mucilaginibacter pallidiroseus]